MPSPARASPPISAPWAKLMVSFLSAPKRAPAYTASLDAALALVERVRPDAAPVEITNLFLYALVQVHKWRDEGQADPVSRLMPLALLAALIKSKMEMENEKDSDDV